MALTSASSSSCPKAGVKEAADADADAVDDASGGGVDARSRLRRFEERRRKCADNIQYGFKDVLAAAYIRNHFDVSR